MADLAWLLATASDDRIRKTDEAIGLAERAADLTGRRDGYVLDVLAAEYASSGHFERAVTALEDGIALNGAAPSTASMRQR